MQEPNPENIKELSKKAEKANKNLFSKLQRTKPGNLDDVVHNLHDEVFEETDCLECGNCCKTTSPALYEKDIERLSRSLRLRPSEFIEKYLRIDEDKDYVFKGAPCPFLGYDNYCSVYESRPTACREYPHTDRKRFHQILNLTYNNLSICPAVYKIVEELKKVY